MDRKKNNCSKHGNPWRLNNSLINDIWVKAEIKKEIKFIETNESENTIQDFLNGMFLPSH